MARTELVMKNIKKAIDMIEYKSIIQVISRSDSTLRGAYIFSSVANKYILSSRLSMTRITGHFPAEVDALRANYMGHVDGTILFPAFFEGGRYTLNDIHYLKDGNDLVPVGQTPFAKDPHFGYESSDLKAWVAEKMKGRPVNTVSISLQDIREGGPLRVTTMLEDMPQGSVVIVNGEYIFLLSLCYFVLIRFAYFPLVQLCE